jgi:hypothetical protein
MNCKILSQCIHYKYIRHLLSQNFAKVEVQGSGNLLILINGFPFMNV